MMAPAAATFQGAAQRLNWLGSPTVVLEPGFPDRTDVRALTYRRR